jgi:hypothetical protein
MISLTRAQMADLSSGGKGFGGECSVLPAAAKNSARISLGD